MGRCHASRAGGVCSKERQACFLEKQQKTSARAVADLSASPRQRSGRNGRYCRRAGVFAALAVLLGACGEPVVSQTMVNHAYDGRTKTLVVYDHLYDGLRARFTTGFDTQFTADMQRCGIAVSIVDSSGVELNWAQHVLQVVRETHADTVLVGNWTRRENHAVRPLRSARSRWRNCTRPRTRPRTWARCGKPKSRRASMG